MKTPDGRAGRPPHPFGAVAEDNIACVWAHRKEFRLIVLIVSPFTRSSSLSINVYQSRVGLGDRANTSSVVAFSHDLNFSVNAT